MTELNAILPSFSAKELVFASRKYGGVTGTMIVQMDSMNSTVVCLLWHMLYLPLSYLTGKGLIFLQI